MAVSFAEPIIKPVNLPQYCSACFNQDSKLRHIDFDASTDRGWYGKDPGTHIAMDDLILCETCIGNAARLLGYQPTDEVMDKFNRDDEKIKRLTNERDKAAEYADRMEEALRHRPKGDPVDHRKRPRAKVGQED